MSIDSLNGAIDGIDVSDHTPSCGCLLGESPASESGNGKEEISETESEYSTDEDNADDYDGDDDSASEGTFPYNASREDVATAHNIMEVCGPIHCAAKLLPLVFSIPTQ